MFVYINNLRIDGIANTDNNPKSFDEIIENILS